MYCNAEIRHTVAGTQAKVGDPVLVEEEDSVLARKWVHPGLVAEHWKRPWEVKKVLIPELSANVVMGGRRLRHRRECAVNMTMFHMWLVDLPHDFGDEFANLAWRADQELAQPSTVGPTCRHSRRWISGERWRRLVDLEVQGDT